IHGLQVAQPRRIRGGHIDHQVVGDVLNRTRGLPVVIRRELRWSDLRLAQVHTHGLEATATGESLCSGNRAVVVETHAVEDRAALRTSEQARGRVGWLRNAGQRARLRVSKAERTPELELLGVLIEARS